ncbi:MAG: ROK family protein [Clostridia bacterium]
MEYYIGIDLGGTNIACGLVNEKYEILLKKSIKTALPRTATAITEDMAKLALSVIYEYGLKKEDIKWIGIGSPGAVNFKTGIVERFNKIHMDFFPMAEMIYNLTNIKTFLENDANAAVFGEYLAGSAKEYNEVVMITIGTGIGGGVILNGKIMRGFNYAATEFGHMVINQDGRQCSCGRKGCFETLASATGLITTTKEFIEKYPDTTLKNLDRISGRSAFAEMLKGDNVSKMVVEKYISDLACGVTNLINIFQPDVFLIGGGISSEGNSLLCPLREKVAELSYTKYAKKQTLIKAATLHGDAGIIGASMLGKQID